MAMKKDNLKPYPRISMKVMVMEIRRKRMMIMTGLIAMIMITIIMMIMMRGWKLMVMTNDNLKP
jgi:hypothetical protein